MARKGVEYIQSFQKARLDYVASRAVASCIFPFALPVAIAVMAERGTLNPLFKQERVGQYDNPLEVAKFETLNKPAGERELHGGSDHPDASRLGRFLRRKGLDELPQILNVVRGETSMVGVRAVPEEYLDYYESFSPADVYTDWLEGCYRINQGVTGLGQLMGKQNPVHDQAHTVDRFRLEIWARDHTSLKTDMQIIMATPLALFTQRGHDFLPKLDPLPEPLDQAG